MLSTFHKHRFLLLVLIVSTTPFILNLLGFDFASQSINFLEIRDKLSEVTPDDKFHAIKGGLHHALLEWTAVSIALVAGFASFLHYYRHHDISVPIIGLALLCAGFTDAFHTLAATRIISANVPNTDFIPFTWAFSRVLNGSLMIIAISISLWIRHKYFLQEKQAQVKWQKKYGLKVLLAVGSVFISFAIIAVILAATSDSLPQTIFKDAFITRPYDVLPLALFCFAGALAWSWYKASPSVLRYSLLLSLIPEIITQLHMAFGSTELFDNHFNIAHGLKIVAYFCLLIGILQSLLGDVYHQQINKTVANQPALINHSAAIKKDLLFVGSARYPQTLVIPAFTFLLAILITFLTTFTFLQDTNKLFKKEKLERVAEESFFVKKLINSIYEQLTNDVYFLQNTPPPQNIIQAIKLNHPENDQVWRSRLATIFKELVSSERYFQEIRFVQISDQKRELVRAYRKEKLVFITPDSKLSLTINQRLIEAAKGQPGTMFYDLIQDESKLFSGGFALSVASPIYSKIDNSLFGVIEFKVDISQFLASLNLEKLSDGAIIVTNQDGQIIKRIATNTLTSLELERSVYIQDHFPSLKTVLESNQATLEFSNLLNSDQSGFYSHIQGNAETASQLRLFIFTNHKKLQSQIEVFGRRSLLMGFGLAVFALVFAIIASRRITQPMQQIIQELTRFEYTGEVRDLPIDATDEVGVFARSFHNMLIVQKSKDIELLQQKFALDEHAIVSTTNLQGDITYVNQKFCDISGYQNEDLIGKNHRMFNSGYHGMAFFKEMYELINQGKTWDGEFCNKNKKGGNYWVKTTIVPFMKDGNTLDSFICISTDITQSKMNSLELTETRDILSYQVAQLKDANADLDQFAYVASHDLKSPLNGISQLVSWIDEDCADILPEESKQHLNLLKSRSKRMLNLLNDLLEYSRIGRDEHAKETINLKETTDELFELHNKREDFNCQGQDVDIVLQRIPFEMVLRNLISNAIKHHDKESGNIDVSYQLVDREGIELHQFKVTDDGPGIPVDLQEKAMEMFQTLQSRDETEGSGMGLAMVKKMTEKYEGSLAIESDGHRGTTFIVEWGV